MCGVQEMISTTCLALGLAILGNFPVNEEQSDRVEAGSEAVPGIELQAQCSSAWIDGIAVLGWARHRLHGYNPDPGFWSAEGREELGYALVGPRLHTPEWNNVSLYGQALTGGGYYRQDGRGSDGTKLNDRGFRTVVQPGAGLTYDATDRVTVDLGYRRLFILGEDMETNSIRLGLTVALSPSPSRASEAPSRTPSKHEG